MLDNMDEPPTTSDATNQGTEFHLLASSPSDITQYNSYSPEHVDWAIGSINETIQENDDALQSFTNREEISPEQGIFTGVSSPLNSLSYVPEIILSGRRGYLLLINFSRPMIPWISRQ